MTDYHDYNLPDEGQANWHEPLNENFREIDRDIEVRDTEARLNDYEPKAGTKFLATDTGSVYFGNGNEWSKLPPSGKRTSDIVVYEFEGTPYAVSDETSYTGEDIFAALQQALDREIETAEPDENNRLIMLHLDIFIVPGFYEVENTLSIREKGLDTFSIRSVGEKSAYIMCTDIPPHTDAITIDPDAGTAGNDRVNRVLLSNLALDHRAHKNFDGATSTERDTDGVKARDVTHLAIRNCEFRGFRTALDLENIWQGQVDNVWVTYCGSSAEGRPAIYVTEDQSHGGSAASAVNHVEFNHLQGGHGYTEYAFLETNGKVQQCDIRFPNIEAAGNPAPYTFRFSEDTRLTMSGGYLGGDQNTTVILQNGGRLVMSNMYFDTPNQILETRTGSGFPETVVSNIYASGETGVAFDLKEGRFEASNLFINGFDRAYQSQVMQTQSISSSTFINQNLSAIKLSGAKANFGHQFNDLIVANVSSDGEHPIYLDGGNSDVSLTNVSVSVDSSSSPKEAVHVRDGENLQLNNISFTKNISSLLDVSSNDATFRRFSGEATINSESTSVAVSHHLSSSPTLEDINVLPASSLGQADHWWVDSLDDSTFNIHLDQQPHSVVTFGWNAAL